MLQVTGSLGFEPVGVEYSPSARDRAAAKTGAAVTTVDAFDWNTPRFDVIHLGDVLEHLPNPVDTMNKLGAVLRKDGCFLVQGPLQANSSLVYFTARAAKALKRISMTDQPREQAPTHLIQVSAATMRWFFERRLGWTVSHFHVFETGWPYVYERDFWSGSLKEHFRAAIGLSARVVAKIPSLRQSWGNRFWAILQPPATPSSRNDDDLPRGLLHRHG